VNRHGRRRLRALGATVALAIVAAGCGGGREGSTAPAAGPAFQAAVVAPPTQRPSFTLTDTDGQPYDFAAETAGRTTLLYFGYINCPDICPVHLANIKRAFEVKPSLGSEITVVFVGVDPARDTAADVREYLDRFDTRFVGLVGTVEEVRAAEAAAGVPPSGPDVDDPDVVGHAGQVLGYGPDDLLHVQFPALTRSVTFSNDLELLVDMGTGVR
jgi:protein SCO1